MRLRPIGLMPWLLAGLIHDSIGMTKWMDPEDLTSFVSRPELKVPQLMLKKHHPEKISPGYIFMAPYIKADAEAFTKIYQPCQVGPNIYDSEGELVWSGACIFSNRNVYDFKVIRDGSNSTSLSAIVGPMLMQAGNKGYGVIIGPSLEAEHEEETTSDIQGSYMHEFSVMDGGNTALFIHAEYRERNVTEISNGNRTQWTVRDEGFREVDLRDGSIKFQWWAMDHIPIEETFDRPPLKDAEHYDVYHINSIERTAFGQYVVSMRHTNTIYLISGLDGHVMWRLGGRNSSFTHLDGFQFSAQHDARILSENPTNGTIVMSLLDNAGATGRPKRFWTAANSSALTLELNTSVSPMTARVLRRYERPDNGMTVLRGNAQVLPDGNVLAGWSSSGYLSEFTEDGTLVLQGRLTSTRMSTYRTYKFTTDEVKLFPAEPIALVCRTLEFPDSQPGKLSVMYVSWNGATEVKRWKFAVAEDDLEGSGIVIGTKKKQGFETVARFDQAGNFAVAYGLDQAGNVLGKSKPVKCVDMIEAGSTSHEFADAEAYYRPPAGGLPAQNAGAAPSISGETDVDASHKDQEKGTEASEAKESTDIATSNDEAPKAGNAPPELTGLDRADDRINTSYTSTSSPRLLTMMLFLSVSLAGIVLLIRRLRRRIF